MKQNWYQLEGTKLREFITILHIPYTAMCLSFLTIGFSISSINNWNTYWTVMLAYFIGLGIAAHSFDQIKGMGSSYVRLLSDDELVTIGVASLLFSVLLGVTLMLELGAWYLIILIPLQVFFVFTYPMKVLFRGLFHNDLWFAVSFGFLPVIIGYYVNTISFSYLAVWWGLIAFVISLTEINLSRYVRNMRKLSNTVLFIEKPERALKLLCLMTYLIAIVFLLK